jgi:hypothetical protein
MAASASAIRAGKASVEIGGDDNPLMRALDKSARKLKTWGDAIAKSGAFSAAADAAKLAAFGAAAKSSAAAAVQMDLLSQRTNVGVAELSRYDHVASQVGLTLDDVAGAFSSLSAVTLEAAKNGETARHALRTLGVPFEQWERMNPAEQLERVVAAAAKVSNIHARKAFLDQFFGDATTLMPLVNQGAAGIRKLKGEADALGFTIKPSDVAAAKAMSQNWSLLKSAGEKLWKTVGFALAPAFRDLGAWLAKFIPSATRFVDENRAAVVVALKVAAAFVAGGAALVGFGLGLKIAGAGLGLLRAGALVVAKVVGGALVALLSPVGLVVAAFAGLGAAWMLTTEAGREAAAGFADTFTAMVDDSKAAMGAIGKAIAGGDLKAAAAVAWAFIVLEWTRGTAALKNAWNAFSAWFSGMFAAVWYGAQDVFNEVTAAIETAWIESTTFLANAWDTATSGILNLWTNVTSSILNVWDRASAALAKGVLWLSSKVAALFGYEEEAAQFTEAMTDAAKAAQDVIDARNKAAGDTTAGRDAAADQAKAERESRRQAARDDAEQRRQANADRIAAERDAFAEINKSESDAAIKAQEERVNAAKKAFDDALATANETPAFKGRDLTGTTDKGKRGGGKEGLAEIGLGEKQGVAGAFNAARAGQSIASPLKTIGDNTAKANELLAKIDGTIKGSSFGPTWSA